MVPYTDCTCLFSDRVDDVELVCFGTRSRRSYSLLRRFSTRTEPEHSLGSH